MGVIESSFLGGYTPICNTCGIALCWDISTLEYADDKEFWDSWICQECNHGKPMTRIEFYERRQAPATA